MFLKVERTGYVPEEKSVFSVPVHEGLLCKKSDQLSALQAY